MKALFRKKSRATVGKAKDSKKDSDFDEEFLKKLDYLYIVSQKMAAGQFRAKRRTKLVGSGIDFADHRAYTPGDDMRNLDWKVYRRSEKLFVKLFEEEEDLHIYFLVDTSASMHLGSPNKWRLARQVTAALSYIGLSNMDRVSVVPFSSKLEGRLPPSRGKAQIFKVFNFLDRQDRGEQTTMQEAFKKFVAQNKRSGLVVVISDFYDPNGFEDALNVLRYHRFEPLVIQLFDRREMEIAVQGELELVDCETGEVRQVTITPAMVRAYQEIFEEFSQELQTYCTKRQILYFRAPLQESFEDLVLRIFRAGGFLK